MQVNASNIADNVAHCLPSEKIHLKATYTNMRSNIRTFVSKKRSENFRETSGEARTCPAANNQAQVCVHRCHFSCRHRLCQIILLSDSLAQSWEHRDKNPRVMVSSHMRYWLYILYQKPEGNIEYNMYHLIPHHILINLKEKGKWSNRWRQNAEIKITLFEGGIRWEI